MSTPRTPPLSLALGLCLLAWAWLMSACPASGPVWPEADGFDDHSFGRVEDRADFDAHARVGASEMAVLKFVILGFAQPEAEQVRYLDSAFYEFHDEWYWFRLLNGEPVPGTGERPLPGYGPEQGFASVAEIVAWIRSKDRPPPLGMRLIDDRLYSDYFYELAVRSEQRAIGIGTLVHMPARTGEHARDELWGFELEYSDPAELAELEVFFVALARTLPSEIADELKFIARSPDQAELVARVRARDHRLASRLTTYAELAVPGEVEVYNPGLIAGRLRKLPRDPEQAAALLTTGDAGVIWVMPSVPDELPPAAGLITAVPQTPLAHVNLLARNRGIPNVYVGGVLDDPNIDQLTRIHAAVVVLAEADGSLTIEPITEQAYARWLARSRGRRPVLERVDPATLPYTLDLDAEPLARVPELRSIVGGKAAGFPVLRAAATTMPERPLAITTRAYAEHLAELRPVIARALGERDFIEDPRVRYLLLEGREDFDARFSSAADQAWAREFGASHPPDKARRDPLADLLARDGIKAAIRARPLEPDAAAAIDAALRAHFGHFAATQGLRFRSSSTVEDVEGFSGAGLYDSNTGFLDPDAQAAKKDRKKSVAWALRKTWASYWSWEAFEERRMVGIDHLDGAMAVLVHARFDDPLEVSNGVMTLTLDTATDRRGSLQAAAGPWAMLEVDVQLGALSVTNPPPELAGRVLPEVDRVILEAQGTSARIERVASSTELRSGHVLDDAALYSLLGESMAIAERWLEVENLALDPARARSRVTLDLEFRQLAPGWPAYAASDPASARIVIKQVRSLDPGIPSGAERQLDQPIPRDLVLFADRIERRECRGRGTRVELVEVWTDPMVTPALGHARVPFVARVRLRAQGLEGGPRQFDLDHRELAAVDRAQMGQGGPWALALELEPTVASAVLVGMDRLELGGGLLRVISGGRVLSEEPAPCTTEVLFASPDELLRAMVRR